MDQFIDAAISENPVEVKARELAKSYGSIDNRLKPDRKIPVKLLILLLILVAGCSTPRNIDRSKEKIQYSFPNILDKQPKLR